MIRMTDELCARCTNKLATSNHHKDRLCGECQRELGASRGSKSLALREWRDHGRKREITRAPTAPAEILDPTALASFLDRQRKAVEAKLADLDRQRSEAEELLRILSGGAKPDARATG